ncbi:unnamed protein product [Alopecurus aequalis]
MKEKEVVRLALLLSYLVLVTRGEGIRSINQGEHTRKITTYQQVNKSIQMGGQDIFDCIDVNLQPAFNHPLLRGHKIQMEPSSFPEGMDTISPLPNFESHAQLPTIECPTGTVPILRDPRRDNISPRSTDEVIANHKRGESVGIRYLNDDIYGTRAILNVYEPKVNKDSEDLSASWIQINNGADVDHKDTIGAGFAVYPKSSGDSFARFHVGWDQGVQKSCYDHTCHGFVQVNPKFALGGRIQPVSAYNGPQYVITVFIFKDPKTNNWWVTYGKNNTLVGYWPNSIFSYIKDKGDSAFWGGHVSGPTSLTKSPQIGSGHYAQEGYGKAAYIKNIQLVNQNNNLYNPDDNKSHPGTTNTSKYSVDGYEVTKDGIHIYYGGPGDFV